MKVRVLIPMSPSRYSSACLRTGKRRRILHTKPCGRLGRRKSIPLGTQPKTSVVGGSFTLARGRISAMSFATRVVISMSPFKLMSKTCSFGLAMSHIRTRLRSERELSCSSAIGSVRRRTDGGLLLIRLFSPNRGASHCKHANTINHYTNNLRPSKRWWRNFKQR